jgi:hypothetical protein
MSIEGILGGFMMLVASVSNTGTIDSNTIWNPAILIDKASTKTSEGTWGASAHEEGFQITKDSILKMGGLK